jgi:hypothetical protein
MIKDLERKAPSAGAWNKKIPPAELAIDSLQQILPSITMG